MRGAVAAPPDLTHAWQIAVTEGPHAAPDFFTEDDLEEFYAAEWEVHFNSARTGIRLIRPRPRWAREHGGEAGLHPSNIHDTPYSVGAVDFTGDAPIVLGPDGPSLGGFVCPATVVTAERWKLGQVRPGDTVRFRPIREEDARAPAKASRVSEHDHGVLGRREEGDDNPAVTYRRSGDDSLLVEYGPMVLDLGLRLRVHALAERIAAEDVDGIVDLTPGIRSLQLHLDPDRLPVRRALELLREVKDELPHTHELAVPSRVVHLPLSWDDPATREATRRYMSGVRADAPWCPWNIEFIRRINGLDSVADVHRVVFDADYLVLGLGDVYLGAPVAAPLDPRHRLVTTKYNPAELDGAHVLLVPTAPRQPTIAEVAADLVGVNTELGTYTKFATLLELCGVAVPAGEADGGHFGVTVLARAFADRVAADVAGLLAGPAEPAGGPPGVELFVVGAHRAGQPLNGELTSRGARLVRTATTSTGYRLHLLDSHPPKPGLVRVEDDGARIEDELWALPPAGLGDVLAALPAPMTLGRVRLADGAAPVGFLCEPAALHDAEDITALGSWPAYLEAATAPAR